MSLALTAFTLRGTMLALRLAEQLGEGEVCVPERLRVAGAEQYSSLASWTARQFERGNPMIFVGAAGIAVRAIAPYVRDKLTDPAVLVVDERGTFVIPLLSGHVGGANQLARRIAKLLDATAVVTTATDLNHRFAVDEWAVKQALPLRDRAAAKAISAALLEGRSVGFYSELPHGTLPEGVAEEMRVPGFAVTCRCGAQFPSGMLVLHPPLLAVGIGCKRDLDPEHIVRAAQSVLEAHALSSHSVFRVASVTNKRDEAGIQLLAQRWNVPSCFYPPEELAALKGTFTSSEFVRSVIGVDNVCERSAVRAAEGGTLLVRKTVCDGVTVAVARRAWTVNFPELPEEVEG